MPSDSHGDLQTLSRLHEILSDKKRSKELRRRVDAIGNMVGRKRKRLGGRAKRRSTAREARR